MRFSPESLEQTDADIRTSTRPKFTENQILTCLQKYNIQYFFLISYSGGNRTLSTGISTPLK